MQFDARLEPIKRDDLDGPLLYRGRQSAVAI